MFVKYLRSANKLKLKSLNLKLTMICCSLEHWWCLLSICMIDLMHCVHEVSFVNYKWEPNSTATFCDLCQKQGSTKGHNNNSNNKA